MEPIADIDCQLKIHVHCDMCKRRLMEAIRSIRGVYSVSIDAREGIAYVSGEVDPNMLLGALARSGRHAELLNVRIRHPELRRHYAASLGYDQPSYSYTRSRPTPDLAYYEVDQDYYSPMRRPVVEYPYSYSDNYQSGWLPQARYVPSYPPPQYDIYDNTDHEPLSFCSIM